MQTRLGTTPASSFQLRLKARPDSAFLLRARLSLWLGELGARRDEVFDVALAVSEAFANAVEHPHEPTARQIEVEGCFADGTITVTLRDFGTWGEERQREEGGYGFPLLRQLVDAVEVDTGSAGTLITLRRRIATPILG